ncbi:phage head-tail connector protein [Dielma fastidiosa]|uniref:phage head-tail connector protein n=1 Tax=Dielma fastidiosa TaxID=1034346 RepID=UPI0023F0ADBA|nr:phage head-tail connector protein [Dielma fastidiosa]
MAGKVDHLTKVKAMLGITGNYQDETLTSYIDEVKGFMSSAGVSKSVIESSLATGLIARGVSDLWNYGSGGASLSPYFLMRCSQLAYKGAEANVQT